VTKFFNLPVPFDSLLSHLQHILRNFTKVITKNESNYYKKIIKIKRIVLKLRFKAHVLQFGRKWKRSTCAPKPWRCPTQLPGWMEGKARSELL